MLRCWFWGEERCLWDGWYHGVEGGKSADEMFFVVFAVNGHCAALMSLLYFLLISLTLIIRCLCPAKMRRVEIHQTLNTAKFEPGRFFSFLSPTTKRRGTLQDWASANCSPFLYISTYMILHWPARITSGARFSGAMAAHFGSEPFRTVSLAERAWGPWADSWDPDSALRRCRYVPCNWSRGWAWGSDLLRSIRHSSDSAFWISAVYRSQELFFFDDLDGNTRSCV